MGKDICSVEDCWADVLAKGFCGKHWRRNHKYGSPHVVAVQGRPICKVQGCDGPHKGLGYCGKHYQRFTKYGSIDLVPAKRICSGPGCERWVDAYQGSGLCKSHWKQRSLGKELTRLRVATKDMGRPATCTAAGCSRPHKARGLCKSHNQLAMRGEDQRDIATYLGPIECSIVGCERTQVALGLCSSHYSNGIERWRKHGISPETGQAIHTSQGGSCAICRVPYPISELKIDHDHQCCAGTWGCASCVRGLLCSRCNLAIGQMGDDADRLVAAAQYLRR